MTTTPEQIAAEHPGACDVKSAAEEIVGFTLEEAAKVVRKYAEADAILKCEYCGDVRMTNWPGGCSGEEKFKQSEKYRQMQGLDGGYHAMRYFEKRVCNPQQMEEKDVLLAIEAEILALKSRNDPQTS
jgi:hypothetical protein